MEKDIEIKPYRPEDKNIWDDFVESSKNGTFLFNRDYMDYHSHIFKDNSFLIFRKGKLYCLLPANRKDNTVYSHQGLTYGGLIMNEKCSAEGILEVFNSLCDTLKSQGIDNLIYKPVPYIYSTLPSQEDLYALFRHNAVLEVRNISSTILLDDCPKIYHDRQTAVNKAKRLGLEVMETNDFESFWRILEKNLKMTYGATPVHSLQEINKLKGAFPDRIKLYGAFLCGEMIAGCVCYLTQTTVHAQYISASPEGKKSGAVDCIIDFLKNSSAFRKEGMVYLDLGTSNEDNGRFLNESLIYQKQGFGGRAVCYDTYRLIL